MRPTLLSVYLFILASPATAQDQLPDLGPDPLADVRAEPIDRQPARASQRARLEPHGTLAVEFAAGLLSDTSGNDYLPGSLDVALGLTRYLNFKLRGMSSLVASQNNCGWFVCGESTGSVLAGIEAGVSPGAWDFTIGALGGVAGLGASVTDRQLLFSDRAVRFMMEVDLGARWRVSPAVAIEVEGRAILQGESYVVLASRVVVAPAEGWWLSASPRILLGLEAGGIEVGGGAVIGLGDTLLDVGVRGTILDADVVVVAAEATVGWRVPVF